MSNLLIGLSAEGMRSVDIVAVQEAKKTKRAVGDLKTLQTDSKTSAVNAINELYQYTISGKAPQMHTLEMQNVTTNEIREAWLPFNGSCIIKGIKVTGNDLTGNFSLKLYTLPPAEGGKYIYYSGTVSNIIWDIMDIPFVDESHQQRIYAILENKGAMSTFDIQVYIWKG